jgi:4-amino-4-deoxy-L-arabinose transferase-like glycosyltransferase
MAFSLSLPKNERRLIILLLAVYLLTRLPLLGYLPLIKDEAIYSIMIHEQFVSPTIIPTLFSYPVSWKPILFFWTGALFSGLPLPIEYTYRLPSFLFGLLTVPLLYVVLRKSGIGSNIAFLSTLAFLLCAVSIHPNTHAMIDSMMFFFILLSLCLYMDVKGGGDGRKFLLAGVLVFVAFFIKFILAAMIPALAMAWLYFNDRKSLRHPLFLISLLALPLAVLLNAFLFSQAGLSDELALPFGSNALSTMGLVGQFARAVGALDVFLVGAGLWFVLSIPGFISHHKQNPFMSFWYCLTILPLIGGTYMVWYFLPVMPAIAYFACTSLVMWKGKERMDGLFAFVFAAGALLGLGMAIYTYMSLNEYYSVEKEAGLLLSGKEDVAVIGLFSPTLVTYKYHSELASLGRPLDFGWIAFPEAVPQETVQDFAHDYHSPIHPVVDGSFSEFYTTNQTFRKETGIRDPKYIAIAGWYNVEIPGSGVIYNRSYITIYGK